MGPCSDVRDVIDEFIRALSGLGVSVETVFLFGSHANGTAHEHSDIDLIIVSSSFSGMPHWQRWELLGKAIAQVRKPVEALAYAPAELEQLREARAALVRHILLQPETVEYHVLSSDHTW